MDESSGGGKPTGYGFFLRRSQDTFAEQQRTATRQRAILRAEQSARDDEDDWLVQYPEHLIGWLVDVLEAVEYRWTPVQILDTERQYPGLINDISLEIWQRDIVKKQVKPNGDI